MLKSKNIMLLLLVGFVMMACQNATRPDGVLSEGDFEDLLYDIHLSHYMDFERGANDTLSDAAHRYALTLDVLKQHEVTQAEWDSSLVYYSRHSPILKEIYADLYERLSYVGEGIGATAGNEGADSTNIWNAERLILLTSQRGYTTMQWKIQTDTLIKPGEKLTLQYTALFLNNDTQNRLMSMFVIRLNNDSVVFRNQMSSQTGIYSINLEDDKQLGIKSVSGYFMVMRPQNAMFGAVEDAGQKNNNQIVIISDIKLMHEQGQNFDLEEFSSPSQKDSVAGRQTNDPNAPSGGEEVKFESAPLMPDKKNSPSPAVR